MFYVYVLESLTDGKRYVGVSRNLKRRLEEHNRGVSFATKARRPFELIYYEAHPAEKSAIIREHYLKTGWGRNYLNKISRMKREAKT